MRGFEVIWAKLGVDRANSTCGAMRRGSYCVDYGLERLKFDCLDGCCVDSRRWDIKMHRVLSLLLSVECEVSESVDEGNFAQT